MVSHIIYLRCLSVRLPGVLYVLHFFLDILQAQDIIPRPKTTSDLLSRNSAKRRRTDSDAGDRENGGKAKRTYSSALTASSSQTSKQSAPAGDNKPGPSSQRDTSDDVVASAEKLMKSLKVSALPCPRVRNHFYYCY